MHHSKSMRWHRPAALLLVSLLVAAAAVVLLNREALHVATGSVSRSLCAAAFVSRVDPERIYVEEQRPLMSSIGWAVRHTVDRPRREVRSSVLGLFPARAVYRPGLGCLVMHGDGPVPQAAGLAEDTGPDGFGKQVVAPADPALRHALDLAFAEPDPAHPRLTKAVVVLHDGRLIAERYAPGYGPETPIWAHSVTKSVTQALIGILVRQGRLRLGQPAPIAAWQGPGDRRRAITLDQLLRMDSGLPFDETAGPVNPATHMWFREPDTAAYAASMPLQYAPGTAWGYSNLGYALLSKVVGDATGGTAVGAERFAHEELFAPLGMHHTTIETDAAGTLLGSGFIYASARDLARFGQLFLDDGVAGGRRILPAGWADYSRSRTLDTGYGAGFWTNLRNQGSVPVWDAPWGMPQLPKDMFYARGAFGQYVIIVPSERLVVVRLGLSVQGGGTGTGDAAAAVIAALHDQSSR
ncbi:serine hydrolase domain-containing protein [Frateuria terrea]|uniref:CubicO group peptidase, beta-lactamase class C family n=1 Tax=Frateuria terrea TaxID=529704 RepID=A0A1H6QB11_9GAMM|nr:serine hydrolase [Frateuria terrea]SEI40981.1 CubicO group peptidase, beta-lactamase class C family [Frateuria terrea]SFP06314.1 CubicO group peptidase, beta-lactamase class C family [Frateuria terrea]